MQQLCQRLCETVQFLFNESVPGYGKIFELVKDGEPEIGDIILFPMQSSKNCLGVIFKHATVYCGEGEVVHFQMGAEGCWRGPGQLPWLVRGQGLGLPRGVLASPGIPLGMAGPRCCPPILHIPLIPFCGLVIEVPR
uniref:Uncharacterized protein n=1 Tax=Apteryx owenii TaxID=8824 RepID=A0A8B9NR37_APTOW